MKHTTHIPVLLQETLDGLNLQEGSVVVDATFGGGGHSEELLRKVGVTGQVIGIDRDQKAFERFQANHEMPGNLHLHHANYSSIPSVLDAEGKESVDAILADLGFSSDQIEAEERGLSFLKDGPLDMRLDQSEGETASDLVNTLEVEALTKIFRDFGDEPRAYQLAKAIAKKRSEKLFTTTHELAQFIEDMTPKKLAGKIHPATKVFQALRIAVNQEHEHLVRFLESTRDTLKIGGRLAIISFHSGEDRIVKQFFAEAAKDCVCPKEFPVCQCQKKSWLKILNKKGIRPSETEVAENPRARSATLRIAERI